MNTTKVSVTVGKTKRVTVKNAKKVVVTATGSATGSAGFKGKFTYLSVTAGDDSLVSELPQAVSYVESGLAQYAPTAKVMLPSDIDSKVKQEEGTEPFVVINAGKAGYTGSVTITKITFVK